MEAPKASNSQASSTPSYSDSSVDQPASFPHHPEWEEICRQLDHLRSISGRDLPSEWSPPEFTRAVIGEEAVQDPP